MRTSLTVDSALVQWPFDAHHWAAAVALAAVAIGAILRGRARRLARLRATWGQPIERTRRMTAMADSHRARMASAGRGSSLDDRTWADLSLDEVFAAIDRTRSTLTACALPSAPDSAGGR